MAFILPITSDQEISINIEISDEFLSIENFDSALIAAMGDIIEEAKDFWRSEAGRRLKSSRDIYQAGVSGEAAEDGGTLYLTGELAVAVESGAASFSMAPGFQTLPGKIIPLNLSRDAVFSKPAAYRTARLGQDAKWQHPGWPGVNIVAAVVAELDNEIIPKHIARVMLEL